MTVGSPGGWPLHVRAARFQAYARAAGVLVAIGGSLVLLGWILDVRLLKAPISAATMKPNAAVLFVASGIALTLSPSLRGRTLAGILASLVVLVAAASLSQDVGGWNLGIDQLLVPARSGEAGRMSSMTAGCFVALGIALVLSITSRAVWLGQLLSVGVALVASVACLGFLYGV